MPDLEADTRHPCHKPGNQVDDSPAVIQEHPLALSLPLQLLCAQLGLQQPVSCTRQPSSVRAAFQLQLNIADTCQLATYAGDNKIVE